MLCVHAKKPVYSVCECSSKPLPGMLEAVGQLTGLTRLELLQGLCMSWDLRQIRHLSTLQQLQVRVCCLQRCW
jgi:hypothetical protein